MFVRVFKTRPPGRAARGTDNIGLTSCRIHLQVYPYNYEKGLVKQKKHLQKNLDFIKKETGPLAISQNSPATYSCFRPAENRNKGGFNEDQHNLRAVSILFDGFKKSRIWVSETYFVNSQAKT